MFEVYVRDVEFSEMVRETRYLLVGNLPETTTENEITEYFKRWVVSNVIYNFLNCGTFWTHAQNWQKIAKHSFNVSGNIVGVKGYMIKIVNKKIWRECNCVFCAVELGLFHSRPGREKRAASKFHCNLYWHLGISFLNHQLYASLC